MPHSQRQVQKKTALVLLILIAGRAVLLILDSMAVDFLVYDLLFGQKTTETSPSPHSCCSSAPNEVSTTPIPIQNVRRTGCRCRHCRPFCPMGTKCRCNERMAGQVAGPAFFQPTGCHEYDPWTPLTPELTGNYLLPEKFQFRPITKMNRPVSLGALPQEPEPEDPPEPPPRPACTTELSKSGSFISL